MTVKKSNLFSCISLSYRCTLKHYSNSFYMILLTLFCNRCIHQPWVWCVEYRSLFLKLSPKIDETYQLLHNSMERHFILGEILFVKCNKIIQCPTYFAKTRRTAHMAMNMAARPPIIPNNVGSTYDPTDISTEVDSASITRL